MPIARSSHPAPGRLARAAGRGAATALAAAAVGCGAGGDENADPARIAPPASALYVVATVRPQAGQAEAVERIGRTVFRVSDPGARLQQLVDQSLQRNRATRNVSYADDVEPWLGRRAALVVIRPPRGRRATAAIFAAKDTGAAGRLVDRVATEASPRWPQRSYRGVRYRFDPSDASAQGVVGDYLVAGDEPAFKAVVDAFETGHGLAAAPAYRSIAGDGRGKLAFGYVDVDRAAPVLGAGGALAGGLLRSLIGEAPRARPITLSLSAAADGATLDTVVRGGGSSLPADRAASLVARLPGDAWLALGLPLVGRSLGRALAQLGGGPVRSLGGAAGRTVRRRSGLLLHRGALSGLQDVALFARGSSRLTAGAGIVAATSDPAGARRLVAGLRRLVQHEAVGAGVRTSAASIAGAHGFRVLTPRLPGPIDVVASGDRVVAAYGDATTRDALGTGNPLAAAPQYRAAQASLDGAPPAMLLDFAPVAALAAGGNGPAAQRASAYLSALRTLALGWRGRDDRRIGRMVVRLR